jgi:hypothetical protein
MTDPNLVQVLQRQTASKVGLMVLVQMEDVNGLESSNYTN